MDKEIILEKIEELNSLPESSNPPKYKELEEYADISYEQVQYRFGSWTEALQEVGIKPRNRNITKQELLDEIVRLSEEHCNGDCPRERDVEEFSEYSIRPFYTNFGNWNNALRKSDLDGVYQYKDIPREDLIDSIRTVFEEHGVLLKGEFVEHSKYSLNPYDRRFGGFANAVIEAGYLPKRHRNIPKQKLKEEIKRLSNELNKIPSFNDMQNKGRYSSEVYPRRFGSWNKALKESGFETYTHPSGEEHPGWKGGVKKHYGPSWHDQKQKVKERDDFACRLCGSSDKTPSVHHISPSRFWRVDEEHEKMNHERNLISLCRSCHHKVEGKFKGRNHNEFEELAREYLPTQ